MAVTVFWTLATCYNGAAMPAATGRKVPFWTTIAKRVLPRGARTAVRTLVSVSAGLSCFYTDFVRYLKYSGVFHQDEEVRLRARITIDYHVLEKGLSHHDPRPGFGEYVASQLAHSLTTYRDAGYPTECSQYRSGIAVLDRYREFHRRHNTKVPATVEQLFVALGETPLPECSGGYTTKYRDDLLASWHRDFEALAKTRHSIRHFDAVPVSEVQIQNAVDIARYAPSACNRQPVRVHLLTSRPQIEQVLKLQGGARGFIELVEKLLIVTADLRGYAGFRERNLAYVDGGLFAMTLMYALCYEGIGSCPLNTAFSPNVENQLRLLVGLSGPETPIVMLGLGNLPASLKVAQSARKPLSEYLVIH